MNKSHDTYSDKQPVTEAPTEARLMYVLDIELKEKESFQKITLANGEKEVNIFIRYSPNALKKYVTLVEHLIGEQVSASQFENISFKSLKARIDAYTNAGFTRK